MVLLPFGFYEAMEWILTRDHLIGVAVALSLLLFLPSLLKVIWKQWRIFLAFQKVPCDPKDKHFLFGHAPKMLSDMGESLDWVTSVTSENKWKSMKIRFGPGFYILIGAHPDAAQVILRSDPKSDQLYEAFVPWLGRGLLIANGKRWVRARRLLTPAFHFDVLRPYIKVYNEASRLLVSQWLSKSGEGESFDVYHSISLFTLDVMLRCACSFESNCQVSKSHSPYISAVYELSDLSLTRAMSPLSYYDIIYMMTPDFWKYRRACKIVHEFSMDVIKKRRAVLEEKKKKNEDTLNGTKRKYRDFLDILLEARDEDNVGLSDLEIRAEVDTFMFEGHDTTSNGITWTLYYLAIHPEHQEKCRHEVDAIFSEKEEGDIVNSDDMKRLVHLKYCIKESLRLCPPVPAVGRVLNQDTDITGYIMPKGTSVVCYTYAIHRHPDFWENPHEFDPYRFTPENSKGRHPHAFVPFSAGPRNCIGQEFALNEERVALAHILRNFEFSLDETKPIKKDYLIILRPKPGLFLKLKPRNL